MLDVPVVAVSSPEHGSGGPISCPLSLGSLHSREAAHVLMKSLQSTLGCGVWKVEVGNLPGMGDGGRAQTWRPRDCVFVVCRMNSLTFKNHAPPFRVTVFQRFLLVPWRTPILKEKSFYV